MFIFTILIIIAPGILAALYYLHISDTKTMPPLKITALCITFVYLTNMFSMLINMLKWYGTGLKVLGEDAVWYNLQFCTKYMMLSAVFAVLLPWIVALFSAFRLKDLLTLMQKRIEENERRRAEEQAAIEIRSSTEFSGNKEKEPSNEKTD